MGKRAKRNFTGSESGDVMRERLFRVIRAEHEIGISHNFPNGPIVPGYFVTLTITDYYAQVVNEFGGDADCFGIEDRKVLFTLGQNRS